MVDLNGEYAWHSAALAGAHPPVHEDDPQPGYYTRRFIRGGPMIPACIWWEAFLDQAGERECDDILRCRIGFDEVDPYQHWTYLAKNPIAHDRYDYLSELMQWAILNDPTHHLLNPLSEINPSEVRL